MLCPLLRGNNPHKLLSRGFQTLLIIAMHRTECILVERTKDDIPWERLIMLVQGSGSQLPVID